MMTTPPKSPVGWGLIGCGDIAAKRVAAALRDAPNSALIAVARARAELAAEFAQARGARRAHADWRDLLRDSEVNAVYIATPVALHAEQTIAAAEAGKHVLCEKPMALAVADCARMVDAARRNGVRLGVSYYRHHYPVIERLRDILKSGEIGDPVIADAQAFEPFNPPPDHPRAWFVQKSVSGGGPMADFGCHRIEVLLNLLGPAIEARGFLSNVRFHNRDVEDTCVAHLAFAGGARAKVTVTHAAHERRDSLEIIATLGSARVDVLNEGRLRISTSQGVREEHHPPHANLHLPLIRDFVEALRGGREPAVNGDVGLEVQRVLAKIYERAT